MSTTMETLVEALKDNLGAEAIVVNNELWSDNQLARTIRAALRHLKGRLPSHIPAFTFTGTDTNGNVTVSSVLSWTLDPDSAWGALVMSAAKYQLASAGALIRAKQSLGSVSTVAGSFSQASRAQGLRMVAADALQELERQIDLVRGGQVNQLSTITSVATDRIDDTVR